MDNNNAISYRPYIGPAFSLLIGSSRIRYTVLQKFLCQSPKWADACTSNSWSRVIALPEVDEDLGHTLVHYLYTGTYQTLKLQDASVDTMSKRITEYRRNIQLYG